MKNLILLAALLCAGLASCKKDCEKDGTAILKVKNSGTLVAFIDIDKEYKQVAPGKTQSFEFGLIGQVGINYRWGSPSGERDNMVADFTQCETTFIEISN